MSSGARDTKTSRADVESSLRGFISERSGGAIRPDAIDRRAHLFNTGYVDSMSSLSLLDFIEERYAVTVPEIDLVGPLSTLDDLIAFVSERSNPSR